jgi:hypothetical protein
VLRQFELVEAVRAYDPTADEALLNRAYVYAMKMHGSQLRASGDPYFAHPIQVAGILTDYRLDTATIVTALLHDVVEDCGEHHLAVIADRAHYGLVVEPLAARVGRAMCVDLTLRQGDQVAFTAEAGLVDDTPDLPPADATPAQVMAALIGAVKAGDMALWQALHVDWWIEDRGNEQLIVHPHAAPPDTSRWNDQRRSVLKEVIDARTIWVDDPVVLAPADRYPGAEAIEQVTLWQDHIADFGTPEAPDIRSYTAASVSATWALQRVGAGPWRVVQQMRI